MITEQTKEFLGELLFDTIGTAIREAGAVMRFTGWKLVDEKTKANYMAIVERICDAVKKDFGDEPSQHIEESVQQTETVSDKDIETARDNLDAVEVPANPLLASVLAEDKDHPVTLAPKPLARKKRRAKRKVKVTA